MFVHMCFGFKFIINEKLYAKQRHERIERCVISHAPRIYIEVSGRRGDIEKTANIIRTFQQ